jgi:hypothetical protein
MVQADKSREAVCCGRWCNHDGAPELTPVVIVNAHLKAIELSFLSKRSDIGWGNLDQDSNKACMQNGCVLLGIPAKKKLLTPNEIELAMNLNRD